MQIDAMSSSDDSDSDLSEVEDYEAPVRRRGTWHGPSKEEVERAAGRKIKTRVPDTKVVLPMQNLQTEKKQQQLANKVESATVSSAAASLSASPAPSISAKASSDARNGKPLTLFQILTKANIDWCRYCGTTEGVNWRPGPWGKRTLCNKHGCDFKGYGFACKLPRLDLTSYAHETVDQRIRPVLQHFCHGCQSQESFAGNVMVRCEGCPKAFHQKCHGETPIPDSIALSEKSWFCDEACKENVKKRRVCVELPKKRLPLMSTPKPVAAAAMGSLAAAGSATEKGRSRGIRASISGEPLSARSKDFAAMSSLPTPPVCNARKHSYDFLSNSDAFLFGGISATKRRRVLSVEMVSAGPASPPASNAGDDDAELSDAESSVDTYMTSKRSLFQTRHVRHLTPTSPSMPEIVCFAPPTHEEYDYHPELDHSDDEDDEEDDHKINQDKDMAATIVPSDLFVVEADQG
ncbi:hypothetical protein BX616_006495, partial [Lobosporangium transversale]